MKNILHLCILSALFHYDEEGYNIVVDLNTLLIFDMLDGGGILWWNE